METARQLEAQGLAHEAAVAALQAGHEDALAAVRAEGEGALAAASAKLASAASDAAAQVAVALAAQRAVHDRALKQQAEAHALQLEAAAVAGKRELAAAVAACKGWGESSIALQSHCLSLRSILVAPGCVREFWIMSPPGDVSVPSSAGKQRRRWRRRRPRPWLLSRTSPAHPRPKASFRVSSACRPCGRPKKRKLENDSTEANGGEATGI